MPETVGGRCLGCLVGSGEDFSVIGPGRNPYGFSPLRRYELSLGIQLENAFQEGNLQKVHNLIEQRRKIFSDREGDVYLGKQGVVGSYNTEAVTYYRAGNQFKASRLFKEAARKANEYNDLESYRKNMGNYFHSLLALFESGRFVPTVNMVLIYEALEEARDFREGYRTRARIAYEARRRTEQPSFVYRPTVDDPVVDGIVQRDLADLTVIEAHLQYYRAYFLDREAKSEQQILEAHSGFLIAEKIYESVLPFFRAYPGEENLKTLRIRFNRGRALSQAGNLYLAREVFLGVLQDATEFQIASMEWQCHFALAELESTIHRTLAPETPDGFEHMEKADEFIQVHPELFLNPPVALDRFFDTYARWLQERGETKKALLALERKWSSYLRSEFLKYPGSFEEKATQKAYLNFTMNLRALQDLNRRETEIRFRHEKADEILTQKERTRKEFETSRLELLARSPGLKPFLISPEIQIDRFPVPAPGTTVFRFAHLDGKLHLWKITGRKVEHFESAVATNPDGTGGTDETESVIRLLQKATEDITCSALPVILADAKSYSFPLNRIFRKARACLPAPVFTTRLSAIPAPFNRVPETPGLHTFNLARMVRYRKPSDLEKPGDVLDLGPIDTDTIQRVSRKTSFNTGLWLSRPREYSVVLAGMTGQDPESFRSGELLYEVIRASGTGTLLLFDPARPPLPPGHPLKAGEPYTSSGFRVSVTQGSIRNP